MKSLMIASLLLISLTGCTSSVGGTVGCALLAAQIEKFEPGSIAHSAAVANYNVFCLRGK